MANKTICALTYGDTHVFTLPYGVCSTAAGTAAKVVAVQDEKFSLETGARVCVKFSNTNTASNPTLNVSGTGAKAIMYRGNAISAGYLAANRVYDFIYDGTDWELIGDVNINTTNSTGTTNKTGTKLFLAGATSQASSPTTYSNSGVYIGTDNCLYSNGSKVATSTEISNFSNISQYSEHWWSKSKKNNPTYVINDDENTAARIIMSGYVTHIYYSDNINVSESGEITLADPISTFSGSGRSSSGSTELSDFNSIIGKFFYATRNSSDTGTIYYRTSTTQAYFSSGTYISYKTVSGIPSSSSSNFTYLHSTDRNAYPDSGENQGYIYDYLGVPFEKTISAARIAYGYYAGTGVYGEDNPVQLTFDFSPKFIFISPESFVSFGDSSVHSEKIQFQIWVPGLNTRIFYKYNGNSTRTMSLNGNTFSFYETIEGNGGNVNSLNIKSKQYYYIALG